MLLQRCHIFTEIISAYSQQAAEAAEGQQRFWLMVLLCRCLNYDAVTYSVELFSCSHEIVVLQHRLLTMLFRGEFALRCHKRRATRRDGAVVTGAVNDTGLDVPT